MNYCSKCGSGLVLGSNFCHICGADIRAQEAEALESKMEIPAVEEAPVIEISAPEPPPNASTYVVSTPIEESASTEDERQNLLDRMRKKLKGECITWRVVSIVNVALYVLLFFGFFASLISLIIVDSTYEDYDDEYYYDDEYDYYDSGEGYTYTGYETRPVSENDPYYESEAYEIIFLICYMGMFIGAYALIPTAVVGFIMSAKAGNCLKSLYKDCSKAYHRCCSPAMIILGAIFNPLTLIFTIPSFMLAKGNGVLFREIAELQKSYYGMDY